MATLSFSVDGPTLDLNVSLQLADADAPRIMGYLLASPYGRVMESLDGQMHERAATPEEAARAFANGVLRGLLDQTVRWEKEEAARAAADAIAPISLP